MSVDELTYGLEMYREKIPYEKEIQSSKVMGTLGKNEHKIFGYSSLREENLEKSFVDMDSLLFDVNFSIDYYNEGKIEDNVVLVEIF